MAVEDDQSSRKLLFDITEAESIIDDGNSSEASRASSSNNAELEDLSRDQLRRLFSRVSSDLVRPTSDVQDFFRRKTTVKTPKSGKSKRTPFPLRETQRREDPDISMENIKSLERSQIKPLVVERWTPNQHEIKHSLSTVSITFSEAMIHLAALDDQETPEEKGISLTPKVDGQWRWIDIKTAKFEATYRLPCSTKYTLRIDKERCESMTGGEPIGFD